MGKTIILYLVRSYGNNNSYFNAYWVLTVTDMLLQLCVVYEVASRVFRPVTTWSADLRGVLAWLVGLSIAVALGLTSMASPPSRTWIGAFAAKGNLFAAALMSELFIVMMGISVSAGVPWKSHAGAIAQGLGGYSLISVMIEAGHAYFGIGRQAPAFIVFSQVRMVAYLACVLYWSFSLNSAEQPTRILTREMRAVILTLQTQVGDDLRSLRFRKNK